MLRSPWEAVLERSVNAMGNPQTQEIRQRVITWLQADFYTIEAPDPPEGIAWIVRGAESQNVHTVIVGQYSNQPEAIVIMSRVGPPASDALSLGNLKAEQAADLQSDIALRLLQKDLTFTGLTHPLKQVDIQTSIYTDGLTRHEFVTRIRQVKSGCLIVLWCIARMLGQPPPHSPSPAQSTIIH